jgi:hypothetical protein
MAVDLFEELVRGFLQTYGYFTIENVAYGPPHATTPSDIDILAVGPSEAPYGPYVAVNCKGGKHGIRLKAVEPAKAFKELTCSEWGAAFVDRVQELTGLRTFSHLTATTCVDGAQLKRWTENKRYSDCIGGNPLHLVAWPEIRARLCGQTSTLHPNASPHRYGRLLALAA